jgi:hypothetical protein
MRGVRGWILSITVSRVSLQGPCDYYATFGSTDTYIMAFGLGFTGIFLENSMWEEQIGIS